MGGMVGECGGGTVGEWGGMGVMPCVGSEAPRPFWMALKLPRAAQAPQIEAGPPKTRLANPAEPALLGTGS